MDRLRQMQKIEAFKTFSSHISPRLMRNICDSRRALSRVKEEASIRRFHHFCLRMSLCATVRKSPFCNDEPKSAALKTTSAWIKTILPDLHTCKFDR